MVVENLTNMRGWTKVKKGTPTRRRIRGWSFVQLGGCIADMAEERGLTVVGGDPRHTSHTCSAWRYKARNNRRSQGDFWWRRRGYRLDADWNGAVNIAAKYLAARGRSPDSGLPVRQPIVPEVGSPSLPCTIRLLELMVHDISPRGTPMLMGIIFRRVGASAG